MQAVASSENSSALSGESMTPAERSATAWLATIFALRMFGLFMVLPVMAVHAMGMPGGQDLTLVGLALGIYGLTQACFQVPMGWASDLIGRKPVIVLGLLIFAAGCVWAACASTVQQLLMARALQGAGAISSVVSALLADLTREHVRSKAMAAIGGSIGLVFALSLVGAPALYSWVGLSGIFWITAVLCSLAIWVVLTRIPSSAKQLPSAFVKKTRVQKNEQITVQTTTQTTAAVSLLDVLFNADLLRLNLGIFTLHLTQMALFVVIPDILIKTGHLPVSEHWKVYLPVVVLSFMLMLPFLIWAEKKAKVKQLKLASVFLLVMVQGALAFFANQFSYVVVLLTLYFVSFNVLEALLPSWVSRVAPAQAKGLALGVYNTTQAIGLFLGGALGGWLLKNHGSAVLFELIALLCGLWFLVILKLKPLPSRKQYKT